MIKIGDKVLANDKDLRGRTFTVTKIEGKVAYIQDVLTWERWSIKLSKLF
jgi:hypothetical protein